MDLTTLDFIRIAVGAVILLYVANCLLNQKVWIRKTFSWGTKEEYPKIFQMNIIGGTLIGLFLVASPFLWRLPIASTNNWIRINLQTAAEFAENGARLRKEFQGTWESPRQIYILSVKPEAFSDHRAVANRTFPSRKLPPLIDDPLGFVYVGLTGLSVEDRFVVHQSKCQ